MHCRRQIMISYSDEKKPLILLTKKIYLTALPKQPELFIKASKRTIKSTHTHAEIDLWRYEYVKVI
jgi:hypothetical protein